MGLEQDGVAGAKPFQQLTDSWEGQALHQLQRGEILAARIIYCHGMAMPRRYLAQDRLHRCTISGTGRTFNIKRTYGYNHADCETLTANDTKIMLEIYGGGWSWERRPIILTVNGER